MIYDSHDTRQQNYWETPQADRKPKVPKTENFNRFS